MNLPVLYSFRRCPYAMRARMALAQAEICYELREVALKNKPAALLNRSPKGTVPVLVLPDDSVIDESLDIMYWAQTQCHTKNWLTHPSNDLHKTAELIQQNDFVFKPLLDAYKYPNRVTDDSPNGIAARLQAEKLFVHPLEEQLQQITFLVDDNITLVDMAIFPFIRQFSRVDQTWFDNAPYPKLQQWLSFFLTSEVFNTVMQRYPVWDLQTNNTYIID